MTDRELLIAHMTTSGWWLAGTGSDGELWKNQDGTVSCAIHFALHSGNWEWPRICERVGYTDD